MTLQPSSASLIDPGCLKSREVPVLCLRFLSARQRLAIPYALLLSVELAEDETRCAIHFATHEVVVQGRKLRAVFEAVAEGHAEEIAIGSSAEVVLGASWLGPLVTAIAISPTENSARTRR